MVPKAVRILAGSLLVICIGCAGQSRWAFREPPSARVMTQYIVIEKKKPILFVLHDRDGDWQFLADDPSMMDPAVEVPFVAIVALDSTLVRLAALQPGQKAIRADKSSPWKIDLYSTSANP
jgi:hypothetical protein